MKIIELSKAMICLNCERIFSAGWVCPVCDKGPCYHLSNWVKPIINEQKKIYGDGK